MKPFGCEVFPLLKLGSKERQDKISPVAPGGKGRYRWVGLDHGAGFSSRGARILDTRSLRIHVLPDFRVDTRMEIVREQPEPRSAWAVGGSSPAAKAASLRARSPSRTSIATSL